MRVSLGVIAIATGARALVIQPVPPAADMLPGMGLAATEQNLAARVEASGAVSAAELIFPPGNSIVDRMPTSQLLSAKVLGFGKDFSGYKDRSAGPAELSDEDKEKLLTAPKEEAKEAAPAPAKIELDLSSMLDQEVKAKAKEQEKSDRARAELARRRADAEAPTCPLSSPLSGLLSSLL